MDKKVGQWSKLFKQAPTRCVYPETAGIILWEIGKVDLYRLDSTITKALVRGNYRM